MRSLFALFILGTLTTPGEAQLARLAGERVWVRSDSGRVGDEGVRGYVVKVVGDTLLLHSDGRDTLVPVWPGRGVSLLVGGHEDLSRKGKWIGGVVGSLLGLAVWSTSLCGSQGMICATVLGTAGTGIGYVVGGRNRREVWTPHRGFNAMGLAVMVLPGGRPGVGFSIQR